MSLYVLVKFVHIVSAIVAIGFNASYAVWLRRAVREPDYTAYVLRGIKTLDDRFATPGYILLLVTGFIMVFESGIPLTTFWILAGLILYFVLVIAGFIFYTPTLRAQTELAEAGRADSDEYRKLAQRGISVGGGLVLLVLVIEFLMVTKPTM